MNIREKICYSIGFLSLVIALVIYVIVDKMPQIAQGTQDNAKLFALIFGSIGVILVGLGYISKSKIRDIDFSKYENSNY